MLTSSNVYLASSVELQPFAVLIMSLINVKLYSWFDPYVADSDDMIAEIAQWNTVATLICSIILQYEKDVITSEMEFLLDVVLLTVVVVLAYYCIATMDIPQIISSTITNIRARLSHTNSSPGTLRVFDGKSNEGSSNERYLTDNFEPKHQNLISEIEIPSFRNTPRELGLESQIAELDSTHLKPPSKKDKSSAKEELDLGIPFATALESSNEEDKTAENLTKTCNIDLIKEPSSLLEERDSLVFELQGSLAQKKGVL